MIAPIEVLVVGIPARDEEPTIAACVGALVASAASIDLPVVIAVAADGCSDDTAAVAERALRDVPTGITGAVVRTQHRAAGAARTAAVEAGLAVAGRPVERIWVATTDADTVVDRTWLATHVAWARAGIDGVAGLVEVAWPAGSERLAQRYRASIVAGGSGFGHEHVHGANLGLRGDRWRAVGGCGDDGVGEDRELWQRMRDAGALLLGVDDLRVTTSARLTGRTTGGFAGYLRDLDDLTDADEEGVG